MSILTSILDFYEHFFDKESFHLILHKDMYLNVPEVWLAPEGSGEHCGPSNLSPPDIVIRC